VISLVSGCYYLGHFFAPAMDPDDKCAWLTYYSPFTHLLEFACGCVAALAYVRMRERRITSQEKLAASVGLMAAAFLLCFVYYSNYKVPSDIYSFQAYAITQILGAFAFSFIMFHAARYETLLADVLSWRPLVLGGEASYSIYLLHPFVLQWFVKPPAEQLNATSLAAFGFIIATSLFFCIAMSWGTFSVVEKPARRWLRRRLDNGIDLRSGTAILAMLGLAVVLFLTVGLSAIFPDRGRRLTDLASLRDALVRYRVAEGHFPISLNPSGVNDWTGIGWHGVGENWLPGLVPKYLPELPRDPRHSANEFGQYLYFSNGTDFKLLSLNPEDCRVTTWLRPSLKDPARRPPGACVAYGYWTAGASNM
jgi:hypothetical protein